LIPFGYFYIIPFNIYTVKSHYSAWGHDLNYVRVWLLIEILYFFFWLLAGVIFVSYAYLVKFQAISKNEALLALDDNVWNEKDTDDFLRYLKFEYFLVSYIISFIATEIITGFTNLHNLDSLGARDFSQTGVVYCILLVARSLSLVDLLFKLRQSKSSSDDFKAQKKPSSKAYIHIIINAAALLTVGFMLYPGGILEGQNEASVIWIKTEVLALIFEIPFFLFQDQILSKKQDAILKSIQEKPVALNDSFHSDEHHEGGDSNDSDHLKLQSKKTQKQADFEQFVADKSELEIEEDFFSLAVMCYLKKNASHFHVVAMKRSQLLYQALLVALVIFTMLFCMLYAMYINDGDEFTPTLSHNYAVFIVKFACCVTLHIALYPEVAKGMNLMKFANNQCHQFVPGGSEIGYMLGLVQVFTALLAEGINLFLLAFQHTVSHSIIHFVALHVVMEISNLYFESLMGNKLKGVLHHAPKNERRGRDIKFSERSLFHKLARMFYKVLRCVYVGFIFYYVPFIVIFLQWIV
jgi:hypothetical protein